MDAHEREAAGAAAGMRDTYGRGGGHSIGDSIWFQVAVGTIPRHGRVVDYGSGEDLVVRDDAGQAFEIAPWQVAEF